MRVIVAGSRDITDYDTVANAITTFNYSVGTVISGCARGVDSLGERFAEIHDIPIHRFPANWEKYGRKAGHHRNKQMANNADALIAVWDGKSVGTDDMIRLAKKMNLKVFVKIIKQRSSS